VVPAALAAPARFFGRSIPAQAASIRLGARRVQVRTDAPRLRRHPVRPCDRQWRPERPLCLNLQHDLRVRGPRSRVAQSVGWRGAVPSVWRGDKRGARGRSARRCEHIIPPSRTSRPASNTGLGGLDQARCARAAWAPQAGPQMGSNTPSSPRGLRGLGSPARYRSSDRHTTQRLPDSARR
jgi:hypothetical protein